MYDPVILAKETEKIVIKENLRKYYRRGRGEKWYGGIASVYCCGCNLRCVFCWRLYNSSVIASSGNWDYSMVVSANSSMTLCKNLGANLDESNISLCSLGPWYYEATLIVHNATLSSAARTYQNQYNLFLEVDQETTSASIFCERSFVTVLISAITVAVVLGVYVAGRRKRPFRSRSAHACSEIRF